MTEALSKLFLAADNHGADTCEPDHTVGDLHSLLRCAWGLMSTSQRLQFLQSEEVAELVTAGARNAFEPGDLVAEVTQALAKQEAAAAAGGYVFKEAEGLYYWELGLVRSEGFRSREDAIADAFRLLPIYVVKDENTLGYLLKPTDLFMGVLARNVEKGGHCPKNGIVANIPGQTQLRPATKEDFNAFRVEVPPDFSEVRFVD